MTTRAAPLLALAGLFFVLSHCKSMEPTKAGDTGHWAMTKYLVRIYAVDINTAHEAAQEYFQNAGYTSIESDDVQSQKSLIHGFTEGRAKSLIFRTVNRGPNLTEVKFKAGPAYSETETIGIMDAYEAVLPAASQRK